MKAMVSFQGDDLNAHNVHIWGASSLVLDQIIKKDHKMMRETANSTGWPIQIYEPETAITAVVPLVLGLARIKTTIPSLMTNSIYKKWLAATSQKAVWIVCIKRRCGTLGRLQLYRKQGL
jgi:hypothetical protein